MTGHAEKNPFNNMKITINKNKSWRTKRPSVHTTIHLCTNFHSFLLCSILSLRISAHWDETLALILYHFPAVVRGSLITAD